MKSCVPCEKNPSCLNLLGVSSVAVGRAQWVVHPILDLLTVQENNITKTWRKLGKVCEKPWNSGLLFKDIQKMIRLISDENLLSYFSKENNLSTSKYLLTWMVFFSAYFGAPVIQVVLHLDPISSLKPKETHLKRILCKYLVVDDVRTLKRCQKRNKQQFHSQVESKFHWGL